jgi:hypothetical protein
MWPEDMVRRVWVVVCENVRFEMRVVNEGMVPSGMNLRVVRVILVSAIVLVVDAHSTRRTTQVERRPRRLTTREGCTRHTAEAMKRIRHPLESKSGSSDIYVQLARTA